MATGRPSVACAALALGQLTACGASGGTPDDQLPGLVHAAVEEAPAIDVARAAADPAVLAAAIAMPEHRVTAALGPHTLAARSAVEVSEAGAVVESLTDTVAFDDGGDDAFHGTDDNSADYGREVIATGGRLYLRPRYARWHARPPADGEPQALRDQLGATLDATFELLAPAIAPADRGEIQIAGRTARKIAIAKSAIAHPEAQTLAQKKWREGAEVLAVSGEIDLDVKTGAPLHAHLDGQVAFSRDGHRYTMTLSVDHDVTAIGTKPQITAPAADDTVATPERLREADERDLLLKGMAPPSRKQQPAGATGGSAAP